MMLLSGYRFANAVGIALPSNSYNRFASPPSFQGLSISDYDAPAIFTLEYKYFGYDFKIDSSKSIVYGVSKIYHPHFSRPVVYSFEEYRDNRLKDDFMQDWRDSRVRALFTAAAGEGGGALQIEIPWRVRSKTFQRIFGGDKVGLRVTGNITIDGGLRRQKTDQNLTTQNDLTNYSFHIDQTQRFNIEGKVGDKVSVYVDQDSERMFDFENSLKLEYTGLEDEIIQKIEAGNVSLTLTGTELATFSGTNTGLFGLKTESKLGPLKFTTIASVEKGEKNKMSLTGGAIEQSIQILSTTGMVRNRYYFINEDFRENYRIFTPEMQHVIDLSLVDTISVIDVYRSVPLTAVQTSQGIKHAWAMFSPDPDNPPEQEDRNNILAYFRLLSPDMEYYVDRKLGYIRLKTPLQSTEILACAYVTAYDTLGDIVAPPDTILMFLKLIRPDNPQPSDSTWKLEFKNVYSLQATGIDEEGFKLEVYRSAGTGGANQNTQLVEGVSKTYMELMGIDTRGPTFGSPPDGVIDNNPEILSLYNGEIILPGLRPFDPDSAKGGGYIIRDLTLAINDTIYPPLEVTMPTLYDTISNYPTVSQYYFSVEYKNMSASYTLGFNVLEGSEEVTLNGRRLQKGVGYNIDYMTGNLTILDQAASSPSANVQVLWESGEIFQLDKTVLLGMRSEYELWNPESFVGATALYLNEKPLEERVKLGNEPIRNFVLDANTRLVMKPAFLTEALDFLPLLEMEVPSEITFEGEIARLYPNPNPLNNEATGDNNGVAYVDDFESVKRMTSLGIMRRNWLLSSVPSGAVPSQDSAKYRNVGRGELIWFNPYDQVHINEIWPDREVNSQVASNVHVLDLQFVPREDSISQAYNIPVSESWGGIQRFLSAGYANQSKSKYLEIWFKKAIGGDVTINVDLGLISEDVIPNLELNTEDKFLEGMQFGNGILDDDEDIGLDMMRDSDPAAIAAGGDFWDLNGDGIKQDYESYSNDNYNYDISNKNNYYHINGTENNMLDEGDRRPDTEDLNNNGSLDREESFYRCSFSLPLPDTLMAGFTVNSWQLVRFPLKYAEQFGAPSWNQIEYVRIWLTGCDDTTKIRIATFDLVGNEWEEVVQTDAAGTQHEQVEVSVVNTYDNSEQYYQPPGVSGIRDPITNILSREQSLVLKIVDLPPSKGTAMAYKTYMTSMDFLKYNTLKMFVNGGGVNYDVFPMYDLNMFFRFGSDTSRNYYEIYQELEPGWAEENEVYIDLNQIATIKLERDATLADSTFISETQAGYIVLQGDSIPYGCKIVDGDSLVVVGNPSLSQIRQLTIGVHNVGKYHIRSDDEVEIWLDELRLSDVKKDAGMAFRTLAIIKLSDLGTVNLSYRDQDANFYTLNERQDHPGSALGNSSQVMSGNFKMDKFFPPTWGLSIPLDGSFTRTIRVPKYYPGSDIPLNLDDQTAVDTVKTLNEQKGWGISFSKPKSSNNKILQYTLDGVSCDYDYSESYSTSPIYTFNKSQTHSANIRYNFSFRDDHSLGILGWAQSIPLLKKLKDTRLSYVPTRIGMSMSGSENLSRSLTRTLVAQRDNNFSITRTFNTGWRPFGSMNFDLNRTHRSDMLGYEWGDLINGQFGRENNVTQSFTAGYSPTIFRWLTHDVNYTSSYNWSWGSGYAVSGKSVQSTTNINTSWTLKLSQIFGGGGGQRPGRGGKGRTTSQIEEEKEQEEKASLNPLKILKSLMSKVNDIRFDYGYTRNLSTPVVTGHASWMYQLGLSKDPGVGQVANYSGTSISAAAYTHNYQAKSGLDLMRNLKITMDYEYKTSENYSSNISGQVVKSQYYMFSSDDGSVKRFPFLNLSARLTGLEKLPLFTKYAQTVTLESGINGKVTSNWNNSKSNIIQHSYRREFYPLLSLSISWKGGISTNFKLNKSQTLNDMIQADQKSRSSESSISITANYTRKTGFRIPIPVWPFKNKRFKNNTTFSFTFSYSTKKDEMLSGNATKFNLTTKTSNWSLKPHITYAFSNTVTGGVHYETGGSISNLTGKTSFHEFGFNVNISIRGR